MRAVRQPSPSGLPALVVPVVRFVLVVLVIPAFVPALAPQVRAAPAAGPNPPPQPTAGPVTPQDGAFYCAELKASMLEVVADQQLLINTTPAGAVKDPDLVPAAFLARAEAALARIAPRPCDTAELGRDPARIAQALGTLLQAGRIATAELQPAINTEPDGRMVLKKFVPALFGRLVAETFRHRTGIAIKQTTLGRGPHGPRNRYNAPDDWERAALAAVAAPDWPAGRGYGEPFPDAYRLVKPITIQEPCLACHGGPEGSRGPYGHVREGYRVGEIRGGISLTIPLAAPPGI